MKDEDIEIRNNRYFCKKCESIVQIHNTLGFVCSCDSSIIREENYNNTLERIKRIEDLQKFGYF